MTKKLFASIVLIALIFALPLKASAASNLPADRTASISELTEIMIK